MTGAEYRERRIVGTTKVPFENQMRIVLHALENLSLSDSEVSVALWSPMGKHVEKWTLSMPSVEYLQKAAYRLHKLR